MATRRLRVRYRMMMCRCRMRRRAVRNRRSPRELGNVEATDRLAANLPPGVRHQRDADVAPRVEVLDRRARYRVAGEGGNLRRLLADDAALERLAALIPAQNLVQQKHVVLAA